MKLRIEELRVESFTTLDASREAPLAGWTRLPTCQPQHTCPECPDT